MNPIDPFPVQVATNPAARVDADYGPDLQAILNQDGMAAAQSEISAWPNYQSTPLYGLPGLAEQLGIAGLWYKDEGPRFGLGSFKALGGAYAVGCLLKQKIMAHNGASGIATADLLAGTHRNVTSDITVCTATDGNHGRSVAWGAQMFGCHCVIYIHATVSEGRKAAMESFGAEVRRISGNYDDSVHQAAADAAANGWFVVSDTSYDGYMEVPRDVMHGYSVMAMEAIEQLPGGDAPSHVFIQGGVGGLAAAVLATYWLRFGAGKPRMIMVEPEQAACLYESAKAGKPVAVGGDLETIMAGLAAGEVSLLAWQIIAAGTQAFMTIPDTAAAQLMRLLAEGVAGDPPIVAGESAVAGLAGLAGTLRNDELAQFLELGPESRVLVFGSEGATDPELYAEIVGRSPDQVAGAT